VPLTQIEWRPLSTVHVKASLGRSYKSPGLTDLNESGNVALIAPLAGPGMPGQTSNYLVAAGNNSGLSAQRSVTRTLEAGFSVPFSEHYRYSLAATWFDINYTGLIESLPFSVNILSDPLYSNFIIRNPNDPLRARICSTGQFFGTLAQCEDTQIAGIVDLRLHNADILFTRGIDLHSLFESQQTWGQFTWEVYGTRLLDYSQVQSPGGPRTPLLDTVGNPIHLRILSSLRWEWRRLEAGLGLHYQNSYRNTQTSPTATVASWTTIDLYMSYHIPAGSGALSNLEIGVNVLNLKDQNPPYVANPYTQSAWDQTNATPFNRVITIYARKRW
jgi:iron complex outermembrane recepter protein